MYAIATSGSYRKLPWVKLRFVYPAHAATKKAFPVDDGNVREGAIQGDASHCTI